MKGASTRVFGILIYSTCAKASFKHLNANADVSSGAKGLSLLNHGFHFFWQFLNHSRVTDEG